MFSLSSSATLYTLYPLFLCQFIPSCHVPCCCLALCFPFGASVNRTWTCLPAYLLPIYLPAYPPSSNLPVSSLNSMNPWTAPVCLFHLCLGPSPAACTSHRDTDVNSKNALQEVYEVISSHMTKQQASDLSDQSSTSMSTPPPGEAIPWTMFTRGSYKVLPCPYFSQSDYISLLLLPTYSQLIKRVKPSEKTEATAALYDCFACTDWHMLLPPRRTTSILRDIQWHLT